MSCSSGLSCEDPVLGTRILALVRIVCWWGMAGIRCSSPPRVRGGGWPRMGYTLSDSTLRSSCCARREHMCLPCWSKTGLVCMLLVTALRLTKCSTGTRPSPGVACPASFCCGVVCSALQCPHIVMASCVARWGSSVVQSPPLVPFAVNWWGDLTVVTCHLDGVVSLWLVLVCLRCELLPFLQTTPAGLAGVGLSAAVRILCPCLSVW